MHINRDFEFQQTIMIVIAFRHQQDLSTCLHPDFALVLFFVSFAACSIVDGSYRYSARHQLPIECWLPKKFTYFIKFPRKYPINNVVRCCRIRLQATATDDYQLRGLQPKQRLKSKLKSKSKPCQIKYAYVFKWLNAGEGKQRRRKGVEEEVSTLCKYKYSTYTNIVCGICEDWESSQERDFWFFSRPARCVFSRW